MADGGKTETRLSQYKPRKTGSSQEERRKFLLQEQKRLRDESFNEGRNIIDAISNTWQKSAKRRNKLYKKKFMLSEWLMEVPEDFQEKWIMVPCPVGKRVLVLAGRGVTLAFAKDGRVVGRFRSNLPGGHMESGEPSKGVTLLDCVWSRCNRSYYILDVLAWNNHHLTNCEADFRFYWLRTKLSEGPDMLEISQNNAYPFHLLSRFPCDRGTLETAVTTALISDVVVDGLLFYHSESHYTTGRTPLVGWLKPFMIPDIMQINVCEELLVERPHDYTGYLKFISDFEEKAEKRRSEKRAKWLHRKPSRKMEVEATDMNLQENMEQANTSGDSFPQGDVSEAHMVLAEEESEGSMDTSAEENNT